MPALTLDGVGSDEVRECPPSLPSGRDVTFIAVCVCVYMFFFSAVGKERLVEYEISLNGDVSGLQLGVNNT